MGIDDNKGAYAPPQEVDESFDAKLEGGGRGPLLLIIAAIVFFAFLLAVWGAYKKGIRKGGRNAPPVIIASSDPYKVRPSNPGGEVTPNQDRKIYDIIDDTKSDKKEEVKIVPAPSLEKLANPSSKQASQNTHIGIKAQTETKTEHPSLRRSDQNTHQSSVKIPKTALKKSSTTTRATSSQKTIAKGVYAVQIASFRTNSAAESSWKTLKKKYSSILSDRSYEVIRVHLGSKGVFYRLRITGYQNRKSANSDCSKLKNKKQDCLVVKR